MSRRRTCGCGLSNINIVCRSGSFCMGGRGGVAIAMRAQRTVCLQRPLSRCIGMAISALTAFQLFRFFFDIISRSMRSERRMHASIAALQHRELTARSAGRRADGFHVCLAKADDLNNRMFFCFFCVTLPALWAKERGRPCSNVSVRCSKRNFQIPTMLVIIVICFIFHKSIPALLQASARCRECEIC